MIRRGYFLGAIGLMAGSALATALLPDVPARSDYRPSKRRDTRTAPPSVIEARKRRRAQRRARRITRMHRK